MTTCVKRRRTGGVSWVAGAALVDISGDMLKVPGDYGKRRVGKRKGLDDHLKELMQELGNAINESLSDSDRIAAAIGEIKRAGYDVFLVLEATIGFNKREDGEEGEDIEPGETVDLEQAPPEPGRRKLNKIKLTSQDQKFLKALKISLEEDKH
jgi:hypothetical protein